jgi:hypothetical protein
MLKIATNRKHQANKVDKMPSYTDGQKMQDDTGCVCYYDAEEQGWIESAQYATPRFLALLKTLPDFEGFEDAEETKPKQSEYMVAFEIHDTYHNPDMPIKTKFWNYVELISRGKSGWINIRYIGFVSKPVDGCGDKISHKFNYDYEIKARWSKKDGCYITKNINIDKNPLQLKPIAEPKW